MHRFYPALLLVFLMTSPLVTLGQDLIVTQTGDSLSVRITKEKRDFVHFVIKKEGSGQLVNAMMPRSNVKYILRDYYSSEARDESKYKVTDLPRIRLGLQGGYSRRTASTPDGLNEEGENYYNEMKNGYTISGDFTYYFNEMSGVGISGNVYRSKATGNGMIEDEGGNLMNVLLKDDVSILYVGPYYSMRFMSWDRQNYGWLRFGAGYTRYQNDFQVIYPFILKSSTFGISIETGYDFKVSDNMAIGLGLGLNSGFFDTADMSYPDGTSEEIEFEEPEGLGRFDLTIGLRFLQ